MKTLAVIDGLCSGVRIPGTGAIGGIPTELLEQLCRIYPEGRRGSKGHCFRSALDVEDPRTEAILTALKEAGMRRWSGGAEKADAEYMFKLRRVYDEIDFDASEYLEIYPPFESQVKGVARRPPEPVVKLDEPPQLDIVSIYPYSYSCVIRDSARNILEEAGIQNLVLRPVEKRYESVDYDLYDEDDTWWELRSSIFLPPVAPSMTLIHKDRTPFQGDFTKGCIRTDGLYFPIELHYRREDLAKMEPFDLAQTHEMFGALPNEFDRPLVASQRFYQVCKQNNIRTGWVPVRIDDDE